MRLMRYTPMSAMSAINAAFLRLPKEEIRALLSRRKSLSVKHGLSMFTDKGEVRFIDVQLRPWTVDAAQRRFFHGACLLLRSALARIMPLYLASPKARQIVPLEPEEEAWLLAANSHGLQRPQSVLDRLDATATFASADWRENFFFLEPNSVGIGGVHYIPASCELIGDWLGRMLKRELPHLRMAPHDDIRQMLIALFIRHSQAIGRKLKKVALIEDQSCADGTDEFASVARYFRSRGLPAITGDPRDVEIRRDEVTVKGAPVDLLYRDSEITEILEMVRGEKGKALGIREAFIRNQVISSLAGEFDHKSCWEFFTSPEFARHFTFRQRGLFKAHLLWTRLLFPRNTTSPAGKWVDLIQFSRRHRETLVLKPNRAYGGEGVVFGHQVNQAVWERELGYALRRSFTHVIQHSAPVRAELFPVASPSGTVRLAPYYAVTGFAASRDGIAFLGRSSKEAVVNVSRRGGLIAVFRLG